jgi:hypothetical protein
LILDAPAVLGLPNSGATVVLEVSNAAGAGQGAYFQLPGIAAEIQANVTFTLLSVTPAEAIQANSNYDYEFEINIHSSHDEEFELVPAIDGTGFTATVDGSSCIPVTSAAAVEGLTATKTISVHTGATGSGSLVLNLNGTNFPSFTTSSVPTPVAIAAEPEIPTTEILFGTPQPIGPNAKFVSNELQVKRTPSGSPGNIILSVPVTLKTAGEYPVSSPTAGPVGEWSASRTSLATITTNSADAASTITMTITPKKSGAQYTAAVGELSFTVTSNPTGDVLEFSCQLRVVDTLPT